MGAKPWWFPELTDEAWIARIRNDYPDDTAGMADEDVREEYADGWKYADTWDHLGDAREQFEKLADAYLEQEAKLREARGLVEKWQGEVIPVPAPPNGSPAKNYNCALNACADELAVILGDNDA